MNENCNDRAIAESTKESKKEKSFNMNRRIIMAKSQNKKRWSRKNCKKL
jgi:hypothetical protein